MLVQVSCCCCCCCCCGCCCAVRCMRYHPFRIIVVVLWCGNSCCILVDDLHASPLMLLLLCCRLGPAIPPLRKTVVVTITVSAKADHRNSCCILVDDLVGLSTRKHFGNRHVHLDGRAARGGQRRVRMEEGPGAEAPSDFSQALGSVALSGAPPDPIHGYSAPGGMDTPAEGPESHALSP